MWGASYASETQFSALLGGAPALRAIVPAVTPVASGLGGFRFRGGVPELGSMLAWSHWAIAPDRIARIADERERAEEQRHWDAVDAAIADGSAFRAGALHEELDADETVRWMRDRLREPLDSPDHRVCKVLGRIDAVDVPVLLIGGWFDVFLGSTLEVHRWLAERDVPTHLVVGPWSHDNLTGRIGGVEFGPGSGADDLGGTGDLTDLHLRWFEATLRGGAPFEDAPVRAFLMGEDRWLDLAALPPHGSVTLELLLDADGGLVRHDARPGERTHRSDPDSPVPTAGGATLLFPPYEPGPVDQAEVEARPDVPAWRSAPLDAPVTALGPVRAVVHLATTGTDADVVVRLCDEDPNGVSRLVADGVLRGSARATDPWTGAGERGPVEPGRVLEYDVDLWSTAHVFAPGHRIRVDVAPSSSPRWEVGTNVSGHGAATPADRTVHVGPRTPSRLVLTVPGSPIPARAHEKRNTA
jgi:uncharacterized protein